MQIAKTFFGLQCDGCGCMLPSDTGEGDLYYEDVAALTFVAKNSGWLITHDHRHYCPNCHSVNDDDMIQTIDNRLYDL